MEKESLETLRQLDRPVALLCVCGKYRTGKSYLLDKVMIGTKSGFAVGPTINPCTQGLWMWKRPFRATVDGEELAVVIVDTEGLGSLVGDNNHDSRIVLLSLLLSSLFIYNTVGSIDEAALNSLSLVVNIAKKIIQEEEGKDATEEFAKNFPRFMWILRDFSLQLKDAQGNSMSARQYLESALSLQKGSSESVESKNKVRRLLKHFFAERDCSVLVRPTENEKDLQRLITLPEEKLRKEFVDQLGPLKAKINKRLRAKLVNGRKINGPMLAELCVKYADAINSDSVPSIDTAWSYVCKAQCESALSYIQDLYASRCNSTIIQKLPLSAAEIKARFRQLRLDCAACFKDKLVGTVDHEAEIQLEALLTSQKRSAMKTVRDKCADCSADYLERKYTELLEKAKKGAGISKCAEAAAGIVSGAPAELQNSPGFFEIFAGEAGMRLMKCAEVMLDGVKGECEKTLKLMAMRYECLEKDAVGKRAELVKNNEMISRKAAEERATFEGKMKILEKCNASLTDTVRTLTEKYAEEVAGLKARIAGLNGELSTYKGKEPELNKALAKKAEETLALREQNAGLRRQLEDKGTTNEESRRLETENAVLRKQLEMAQSHAKEDKASYQGLMSTIQSMFSRP